MSPSCLPTTKLLRGKTFLPIICPLPPRSFRLETRSRWMHHQRSRCSTTRTAFRMVAFLLAITPFHTIPSTTHGLPQHRHLLIPTSRRRPLHPQRTHLPRRTNITVRSQHRIIVPQPLLLPAMLRDMGRSIPVKRVCTVPSATKLSRARIT